MKAILTGHQPRQSVNNPILPNVAPAYIPNKPKSNWHTGEPTEEGWYLIAYKVDDNTDNVYFTTYRIIDIKADVKKIYSYENCTILGWEKIEYKED